MKEVRFPFVSPRSALMGAAPFAFAFAVVGLLACGDDGNAGTGGSTLGSGPGGGGTLSTLEGTWEADEADAKGGAPRVSITLSRTLFSLRIDDVVLRAEAQGPLFAAEVQQDRGQGPETVPDMQASISRKSAEVGTLGAVPLPLTGGLRIDSGRADTFCQSTFVDGSISASCGSIDDFGYLMPGGARNGTASGVRISRSDSSFGDLGGTWQFGLSGGGNCTASFVQATVTATCFGAATHTGSFTIAFEGNRASGSTNEGIEFVVLRK